jgi:hypothetical protein
LARQYFDYRAGLGNVGSYQSSAKPFLSSSIHVSASNDIVKIDFINVTRFITIKNTGPDQTNEVEIRVGFSENGVNGVEDNNYFTINNQESFSADWRVNAVYLRVNPTGATTNATASVIAGLTTIASQELFHNWTGSQGVG